jgi:hypothetical protein
MAATKAGLLSEHVHIWIPHESGLSRQRRVSVCEKPSMANSLNVLSELQHAGVSASAMRAPVLPRRGLIARRAGGLVRPARRGSPSPTLSVFAVLIALSMTSFLSMPILFKTEEGI